MELSCAAANFCNRCELDAASGQQECISWRSLRERQVDSGRYISSTPICRLPSMSLTSYGKRKPCEKSIPQHKNRLVLDMLGMVSSSGPGKVNHPAQPSDHPRWTKTQYNYMEMRGISNSPLIILIHEQYRINIYKVQFPSGKSNINQTSAIFCRRLCPSCSSPSHPTKPGTSDGRGGNLLDGEADEHIGFGSRGNLRAQVRVRSFCAFNFVTDFETRPSAKNLESAFISDK